MCKFSALKAYTYLFFIIVMIFGSSVVFAAPPTPTVAQQELVEKICNIRHLFCGFVGTAMITAAVFFVGALVAIGKANWTTVIIVVIGIFVFKNPQIIASVFLKGSGGVLGMAFSSPKCTCAAGLLPD